MSDKPTADDVINAIGALERSLGTNNMALLLLHARDVLVALQKDSARYRFINNEGSSVDWLGAVQDATGFYPHTPEEADAAIDHAILNGKWRS